jgi:hypothetical protein
MKFYSQSTQILKYKIKKKSITKRDKNKKLSTKSTHKTIPNKFNIKKKIEKNDFLKK